MQFVYLFILIWNQFEEDIEGKGEGENTQLKQIELNVIHKEI